MRRGILRATADDGCSYKGGATAGAAMRLPADSLSMSLPTNWQCCLRARPMAVARGAARTAALFLAAVLIAEFVVCEVQVAVEQTASFDWDAYMEQAARFLGRPVPPDAAGVPSSGPTLNYSLLTGDTGPCVYPAVHLYAHAGLLLATQWDCQRWTTEYTPKNQTGYAARVERPHGTVAAVQQGYIALFLCLVCGAWLSQGGATADARRPEVALLTAVLFLLSRRSRSIAILGLFNEAWAMALAYAAVAAFARRRWVPGCVAFALAANTKMNVLLFAPGLLAALLHEGGPAFAARHIALCTAVCACVGTPFLAAAPLEYVGAAFNFGRRFDQQWSVNFGWLSPFAFSSRALALGLLAVHLSALVAAYALLWRPMFEAEKGAAAVRALRRTGAWAGAVPPGTLSDAAGGGTAAAEGPSLRHRRRELPQSALQQQQSRLQQSHALTRPDVESGGDASPPDSHLPADPPSFDAPGCPDGPSDAISFALLSSNVIGVVCARSLHFQFREPPFRAIRQGPLPKLSPRPL